MRLTLIGLPVSNATSCRQLNKLRAGSGSTIGIKSGAVPEEEGEAAGVVGKKRNEGGDVAAGQAVGGRVVNAARWKRRLCGGWKGASGRACRVGAIVARVGEVRSTPQIGLCAL